MCPSLRESEVKRLSIEIPPASAISKMDIVADVLEKHAEEASKYKPIDVGKHLELEYDLGTLMASDGNELDADKLAQNQEDYLLQLTRDNVQLLMNKIWELPTDRVDEAIVVKLPSPIYTLPRARHAPKPRPLTKWEQFAKLKGIQKKKKSKLSWDEQLKKWIPLYGYRKAAALKEKEWVLEVPQNANPLEDQFAKKTNAKIERVSKNELQRLRNIAKARNIKIPRAGLLNPDVSSAKDLQSAVTVARSSTASVGKFQSKLPKEKEAKGVTAITPGASRKRKLPPVSGDQERTENLAMLESVLNKRPKIDIEKAVNRQINQEQVARSEERGSEKSKAGRGEKKRKGPKNSSSSGKKPRGGRGQRKGKSAGRKRR